MGLRVSLADATVQLCSEFAVGCTQLSDQRTTDLAGTVLRESRRSHRAVSGVWALATNYAETSMN